MRIESLLTEITNLYKLAEKDKQERLKQGGFFNVFNTIGLRTEEVRLHSAFIAELLNPQGAHGLSNLAIMLQMQKGLLKKDISDERQKQREES